MHFSTFRSLIICDHNRLNPVKGGIIRHLIFHPSFKVVFWFRLTSYLQSSSNLFFKYFLSKFSYLILKHYELVTGIQLPVGTKIDGGLVFPHLSAIVIHGNASIGKNCTILQGVTIGGDEKGTVPHIGDNVVLTCGAKVIGGVTIGNNVLVGAGAVVTSDIPDNAVVVGVPGKVINYNGLQKVGYYHICG